MSETAKQYPELDELLGGHFHQDWAVVLDWQGQEPNRDAVVRSFAATHSQEYVRKVKEQLQKLLSLSLTDSHLRKIVAEDFGVGYDPKYDKITMRQWLEHILEVLQEPLNPKNRLKFKGGISPETIGLDLDALGFPRINQK